MQSLETSAETLGIWLEVESYGVAAADGNFPLT